MRSPPAGSKRGLQALLLCGGKGERLRPLTTEMPKPLIPVGGTPILGHIIEHLQKHGIRDLVAAVGYKSGKITEYLQSRPDVSAAIVDSGDADILKRLLDCAPRIKGDCLVLYGDTLSDVDLDALAAFHRARPEKVTITVWPLRSQFGLLEVAEDGKVLSFKEKPILNKWINIGYFYFEREALSWLSGFTRFEDFLQHLAAGGKINAYRHAGMHITVNTLKELEEAEEALGLLKEGAYGKK